MKKILFILAMCLVFCVTTSAQDNNTIDNLLNQIICEYEFDDVLNRVNADYEIIYQTDIDAQTMYNNLMVKFYIEKDASMNKVNGMYQFTLVEKGKNSSCTYKIYLKDKRFKITASLKDESAYKYGRMDNNDPIFTSSLFIPKVKIAGWMLSIIEGPTKVFDF